MSALSNRVRRLEERLHPVIERMRQSEIPAGPPAVEVITELLARAGVERGPNESLAETTARAMGWSMRELRQELERRAGL